MLRVWFGILLASLVWQKPITAAEYQWSALARTSRDKAAPSRAFLWIPPNCRMVRAIVLAQHNMEELSILENSAFRRALGELGFAEVWCAPSFDHFFRFTEGAGETFTALMEDLARESGYSELRFAPVAGIGHSAAASWPYYFAAWNPARTLAAISVSGQWPYVRNQFAPDIWGDHTINFVPCLETMGEYEPADTWSTEGLKERQQHPLMPLSMLACPAEGHFAASQEKIDYLALYLKKAAEYRLPRNWSGKAPAVLKSIDPTKTGWLVDKWRPNQPPRAPAAPVAAYKGDPHEAFWYFDQEIAQATEDYGARYRGLKPQAVGFKRNGVFVPQTDSHLQVTPQFEPEADGVTFNLSAAFYDTVPGGSPRLPRWTGLPAGSSIGHAGGSLVSIDSICGPLAKLGPDRFALRLTKETTGREDRYELVMAATHAGDKNYKAAVQQAHILVPARNVQGAPQHIRFPPIPDQHIGTQRLRLNANSDAGAKVYYYVREGPAEIEGSMLRFTSIPPRSRFPIKVTVVAWQYGRSTGAKLQTAEPVERSFHITK